MSNDYLGVLEGDELGQSYGRRPNDAEQTGNGGQFVDVGIAFGTGFILGPALGGLLYRTGSGHLIPALVAGSFSLIAFILTLTQLEEPKKREAYAAPVKSIQWGTLLRHPR